MAGGEEVINLGIAIVVSRKDVEERSRWDVLRQCARMERVRRCERQRDRWEAADRREACI